jgi:hypothetical protein
MKEGRTAAKQTRIGPASSRRSVCAPGAMPFHCTADRLLFQESAPIVQAISD